MDAKTMLFYVFSAILCVVLLSGVAGSPISIGDLNDIATGHELLDDLTDTDLKATSAVFAAGVTAADIEARSGKLLKAAAQAHEELVDMRPFWR